MYLRRDMATKCEKCGQSGVRIEKVDAYACLKCDVWLEKLCSDPRCEFCTIRPDKPSEMREGGDDGHRDDQ